MSVWWLSITSRIASRISSSVMRSERSTYLRHDSRVIAPSSTAPAVPSESVGFDSIARIRPALREWCITAEFSGEQATTSRRRPISLRYPPIPEMRPPPPRATYSASIESSWRDSSRPMVPWPATTAGSLYGETYTCPLSEA